MGSQPLGEKIKIVIFVGSTADVHVFLGEPVLFTLRTSAILDTVHSGSGQEFYSGQYQGDTLLVLL